MTLSTDHPHPWCSPECDDSDPPTEHRSVRSRFELAHDPDPGTGQCGTLDAGLVDTIDEPTRVELFLTPEPSLDALVGFLDAAQARELAALLVGWADAIDASAGAADVPRFGRGMPTLLCLDCGHAFHPDSSPDLDRCWSCSARFDAEIGDDQ